MAEDRRFADQVFGSAGQLTYIPRKEPEQGPGELRCRHDVSNHERCQILGPSVEVYPVSRETTAQASAQLTQDRREQNRWLFNAHPQASMAGMFYDAAHSEALRPSKPPTPNSSTLQLLASGEITDVRELKEGTRGLQVLATATGQAGELLRIARVKKTQWSWEDKTDEVLTLSTVDVEDREDEVIWSPDAMPIRRVKFATSLSPNGPLRWLIVQKDTYTTILAPRYHADPQPLDGGANSKTTHPSRIEPNQLVTIRLEQTRGNAHSDFAFNPGAKGLPPQLFVIDECGYWTTWDISGHADFDTQSVQRKFLRCGRLGEGLLDRVPRHSRLPAGAHGVCLVGDVKQKPARSASASIAGDAGSFATRCRQMVIWNSERLDMFNLEFERFLPEMYDLLDTKGSMDRILDIQASPLNREHIFILTNKFVFWIDTFARSQTRRSEIRPKVILACACLKLQKPSSRMTLFPRAQVDGETVMALVYEPTAAQCTMLWFTGSGHNGTAQWKSQLINFTDMLDGTLSNIGTIHVSSAQFGNKQSGAGTSALLQAIMTDDELRVIDCLFAVSQDASKVRGRPTKRIGWSQLDHEEAWGRKRRQFLSRMESVFVVPDGLEDEAESLVRPRLPDEGPRAPDSPGPVARPVHLEISRLCRQLQQMTTNGRSVNARATFAPSIMGSIREAVESGVVDGFSAMKTWGEIAAEAASDDRTLVKREFEEQALALNAAASGSSQVVSYRLGQDSQDDMASSLDQLPRLTQQMRNMWVAPFSDSLSATQQEQRENWVVDIAKDYFLSTSVLAVQEEQLFEVPETAAPQSQMSIPSSPPVALPPMSSSGPSSTPVRSDPDAAFERLRLLAPSIKPGSVGSLKAPGVLSLWPSDRGTHPSDYTSSVAQATERQFDDARQRKQKKEAKRKALAEKYKRPAFMRQGLDKSVMSSPLGKHRENASRGMKGDLTTSPAPQGKSSQEVPGSSQVGGQGITMSQPVSGTFGDRKKAKKGSKSKKKSGFR